MAKGVCTPLLTVLGVFLLVVGGLCLGFSVLQGIFVIDMFDDSRHDSVRTDPCSPRADEKGTPFRSISCPGIDPNASAYQKRDWDALCDCKQGRTAAWAIMSLVSGTQFVLGIACSVLGCICCRPCCGLRRTWIVLCGFVAFFFFFCLVSFALALRFKMQSVKTIGRSEIGLPFTVLTGVDMFFSLIAIIICVLGIIKGDKDPAAYPSQSQSRSQGQVSQNPSDPPPAYSKSQTNTSAKSKSSSQRTSKRQ